jgi:galactose mutarotase-like enzyme
VAINRSGAEICSITNRQGLEYIWQANESVWSRHAPVLFPIVGRLKGDVYNFENKDYQLTQHGFARDLDFSVVEEGPDSCVFELASSEKTLRVYPFEFMFRIAYRVSGNRITTSYTVINPGEKTLWFSVGAHPGFNCSLQPNETFEDYYLEFEPGDYQCTQLAGGLRLENKHLLPLVNNRLFLTGNLFDNDALVFENNQVNRLSLASVTSTHRIELECNGWPYFGIWARKGIKRFICLEPWYGVADALNTSGRIHEKAGIMQLGPGKEFSCNFSIVLH